MADKFFSFNEFGPSALRETSAFLRSPTLPSWAGPPQAPLFPDRATTGGLQGLSRVSKRPRMAISVANGRRPVPAERLHVNRQHSASTRWLLTAFRLLWNPLDQHGLTAVTLLGEEPVCGPW